MKKLFLLVSIAQLFALNARAGSEVLQADDAVRFWEFCRKEALVAPFSEYEIALSEGNPSDAANKRLQDWFAEKKTLRFDAFQSVKVLPRPDQPEVLVTFEVVVRYTTPNRGKKFMHGEINLTRDNLDSGKLSCESD